MVKSSLTTDPYLSWHLRWVHPISTWVSMTAMKKASTKTRPGWPISVIWMISSLLFIYLIGDLCQTQGYSTCIMVAGIMVERNGIERRGNPLTIHRLLTDLSFLIKCHVSPSWHMPRVFLQVDPCSPRLMQSKALMWKHAAESSTVAGRSWTCPHVAVQCTLVWWSQAVIFQCTCSFIRVGCSVCSLSGGLFL